MQNYKLGANHKPVLHAKVRSNSCLIIVFLATSIHMGLKRLSCRGIKMALRFMLYRYLNMVLNLGRDMRSKGDFHI
jgi:hypothetical protein